VNLNQKKEKKKILKTIKFLDFKQVYLYQTRRKHPFKKSIKIKNFPRSFFFSNSFFETSDVFHFSDISFD